MSDREEEARKTCLTCLSWRIKAGEIVGLCTVSLRPTVESETCPAWKDGAVKPKGESE